MTPVVAFCAALAVALFGLVSNLAVGAIPDSWMWTSNWTVLGPVAALLLVISALLTAWVARTTTDAGRSPPSPSAVGAPGPPVLEPAVAEVPGQVVGELPGEPLSFQARGELAELRRVFDTGGGVAVVCALTGSRGVGKTQLAAAYAREQVAAGCPLVGWVSGENTDGLVAGLAEVARAVGVADPEGDSLKSAQRLRSHLQTRRDPAVLVIDNAVDADGLRRFLPATGPAQLIVTSTDRAIVGLGSPVAVPVFTREQSVSYLRERTGLADDAGAGEVAEELGDLPLALAQAATVIELHRLGYSEYLSKLHALPVAEVLVRRPGDAYPKGTAEAILLAVQAAEETGKSGTSARLLELVSVLSPNGVHRALLRELMGHLRGQYEDAAADGPAVAAVVDETVARLVGMSLLGWDQTGTSVIMHRLVARVVRERQQAAGALAVTVLGVVEALLPLRVSEEQAWKQRERGAEIVDHTLSLWTILLSGIDAHQPTAVDAEQVSSCAPMATWAVWHLTITADLSRAVSIGKRILADCERVPGPEHPDTLRCRNNLAYAHESAGRLGEAIALFERTLADCERVLGPQDPDTLVSRNNLAIAYASAAGRLDEAIGLFERTLADRERVLGPQDPDTLRCRINLANAYESAGWLDEAIGLFERTLTDRERVLGAEHPDTLRSRNNLAHAYGLAGQRAEAIALFERTLTDCERVLGAEHPDTLRSRNDLAHAYGSAGRLDEASGLFERTLRDCERLLDPDHSLTSTVRSNLQRAQESMMTARSPRRGRWFRR